MRNGLRMVEVRLSGFLLLSLLIADAYAFVGGSTTILLSKYPTFPSVRPLHLLNVNRVTKKRKKAAAEDSAVSNPRNHFPWNNFLIPAALQPRQQQQSHDHITTIDKSVVACFVGLFVAFLSKFVMMSSPGSWRYFLAGGLCAASSHAIPTPIDVVKVSTCFDIICFSTFNQHQKRPHRLLFRRNFDSDPKASRHDTFGQVFFGSRT